MVIFNAVALIKAAGYLGVFAIIFAESGLLVGFFLPGDSLLFTAGFLASQQYLNIWLLIPLLFVAAVAGDNLGYFLGHTFGPKIFSRDDSFFFHRRNVSRTKAFFGKYGAKAIILARFIPVVRTFTPVVAGVGNMKYKTYFAFDLMGGLLWAVGVTLLGYYLGAAIPNIDTYLLPIIIVIVVVSFIPIWIQFRKMRKSSRGGDA